MALPKKDGASIRIITLRFTDGNRSDKEYRITITVSASTGLCNVYTEHGPTGRLQNGKCVASGVSLTQANARANTISKDKQSQGDAYRLISDDRMSAPNVSTITRPAQSAPPAKADRITSDTLPASSRQILTHLF